MGARNLTHRLGRAATTGGWRAQLADRVAPPVAARTHASEDDVRAALGIAFLVLSIVYVWRTLRTYAARR